MVRISDGSSGRALSTIKRRLSTLSGFYAYLVASGTQSGAPRPRHASVDPRGSPRGSAGALGPIAAPSPPRSRHCSVRCAERPKRPAQPRDLPGRRSPPAPGQGRAPGPRRGLQALTGTAPGGTGQDHLGPDRPPWPGHAAGVLRADHRLGMGRRPQVLRSCRPICPALTTPCPASSTTPRPPSFAGGRAVRPGGQRCGAHRCHPLAARAGRQAPQRPLPAAAPGAGRTSRRLADRSRPRRLADDSSRRPPLTRDVVGRIVRRVARAAGIAGAVTPHRLRHTLAAHKRDGRRS